MTTPYQAFPNSFKRDLLAGKKLIGCWSSLASPITTEVLGVAGFDWILLDGEHSPNDMGTYIPQLMALNPDVSGGVAVWAHVGGFVAGVVLIRLFEDRDLVRRRRAVADARRVFD